MDVSAWSILPLIIRRRNVVSTVSRRSRTPDERSSERRRNRSQEHTDRARKASAWIGRRQRRFSQRLGGMNAAIATVMAQANYRAFNLPPYFSNVFLAGLGPA
jgi:hypothetical protein